MVRVANTQVVTNKQAHFAEDTGVMPMKTYDEILSENGYECDYYGKWHAPVFRARIYNNPVTAAGIHKTELGPGKKAAYLSYLDPLYPDRALKEGELEDTLTERPYVPHPIDRRFDRKNRGLESDIKVGQSDIHGVTTIPAASRTPEGVRAASAARRRRPVIEPIRSISGRSTASASSRAT